MLDAQPPIRGTRDVRIDFFRGLALYMILVDHVVGDPIGKLTFRRMGFSDAAELFVFLSGISCAIVYSGVLARRGWGGLLEAIARRASYIYAFYLLTCIAVILLTKIAASLTSVDLNNDPFLVVNADPISAVQSALLLTSPPALPGILVLYLMLTLIVIPLVLLVSRSSAALPLAVSVRRSAIAQCDPNLLGNWQIARCSTGWRGRCFSRSACSSARTDRTRSIPASTYRALVSAAWLVVIGSLAYRVVLVLAPAMHIDIDWLRLSPATVAQMKENLSLLRLVHFLSVAFLVANYVKSSSPFFGSIGARQVIQTGRHSLEVYCVSAICSVILNIIVVVYGPGLLAKLLLDATAIALILLSVWILGEARRSRKSKEKTGSGDLLSPIQS